ncbi:MAG: hypothetical protein ACRDFY_03615 [Candidatus Limnocylindria bacterium]
MGNERPPPRAPDGIEDEHAQPIAGWRQHASPISLVVFGAVLALALTGLLGREVDRRAEGDGARLAVHTSEIIRNGEFFEMRISVEADAPIGELVVAVDEGLWEDMTVNTMIPAATDEESVDGEYRFTFAPLEAGERFALKVDIQVNPDIVGGNDGAVTVYDGDQELASTEVDITVLP